MSYDFHIEESGKSLNEWVEFAESHPLLKSDELAEAENPLSGEQIQISLPNSFRGPQGIWLVPREKGAAVTITIYSPREEDIPFMRRIAADFGGKLVGDEGEEY